MDAGILTEPVSGHSIYEHSMVVASTVASHQEGFRFESPGGQEHLCAMFSPCASALQVVLGEIAELTKIN